MELFKRQSVSSLLLWTSLYSIAASAEARDYHLLNAEKLDVEYSVLDPNNRDPYVPEQTGRWKGQAALKWDVSVLDHLYWRNNTHMETVKEGTVKTVGWEWEFAAPYKQFEAFTHHHSRHVLDQEPENRQNFPVENSYGIRVRLLK